MTFECKECGHRWNSRKVDTIPKMCPKCLTKYYNSKRIETRGRKSKSSGLN